MKGVPNSQQSDSTAQMFTIVARAIVTSNVVIRLHTLNSLHHKSIVLDMCCNRKRYLMSSIVSNWVIYPCKFGNNSMKSGNRVAARLIMLWWTTPLIWPHQIFHAVKVFFWTCFATSSNVEYPKLSTIMRFICTILGNNSGRSYVMGQAVSKFDTLPHPLSLIPQSFQDYE